MSGRRLRLLALLVCGGLVGSAQADVQVFTFSLGDLSAKATFEVSGGKLTVTLENTAGDPKNPESVLTGLFFDISDFVVDLTRETAKLTSTSGTPVLNGTTGDSNKGFNSGGDISGEAGYRTGATAEGNSLGFGGVGNHAIGMVGMEDFMGKTTRFDDTGGGELGGPPSGSLGGIEYGLVNPGFSNSAGHPKLKLDDGGGGPGPNELIQVGVKYTFADFTSDGGLLSNIDNVAFNFGTDFNPIPAPGAALLAMMGMGFVSRVRRKKAV